MTDQTSIADGAETKVRSRLAQHLQEPHSAIRLKASDLVRLLEEFEQLRAQLAGATAAHVTQVAEMQANLDVANDTIAALDRQAADHAARADLAQRVNASLVQDFDQVAARYAQYRTDLERKVHRLQRELRAARAA